jgi:tetratricopeptide (TPR) repeat protein
VHDCDRLAARPDDPLKPAQVAGVLVEQIDVRKALPACLEAVKNYAGTTRFAYQLGRVYQAARNISDATVWYRRAADAGYAPAQVNLGIMYANGRYALARNDAEAVRLYRLAANQGYARGQNRLGYMYEEGRGGLVRDTAEALRLYRLAAAQGNEFARRAIERLHHMERPRYMERHRHRGRWWDRWSVFRFNCKGKRSNPSLVEPGIYVYDLGGLRLDATVVIGASPEVITQAPRDIKSNTIA